MTKEKPKEKYFRTKIPNELHQIIMEWYVAGVSYQLIKSKLISEHNFKTNDRTLGRLITHMRNEKSKITEAALANAMQQDIVHDLKTLNKLSMQLEKLADDSLPLDKSVYLRTVDRLAKILCIKFNLNQSPPKEFQEDSDEILQKLLDRLGK
jgi:hypothetical protein